MLIASHFLLWVTSALLVIAVLALARQIAALQTQLGPAEPPGAAGPRVGDRCPQLEVRTLDGEPLAIGPAAAAAGPALLLFVEAANPASGPLVALAVELAEREGMRLILVIEGQEDEQREMMRRHGLPHRALTDSPELAGAFQVKRLPHAVLVTTDGTIAARGLVDTLARLERLVVWGEPPALSPVAARAAAAST